MLTVAQKPQWTVLCEQHLTNFRADKKLFIERYETWVHHYDPETKILSMQWKHKGSPTPKKFKVLPSAGKVLLSVFCDAQGVIMVDYLQKGATITGLYYAALWARWLKRQGAWLWVGWPGFDPGCRRGGDFSSSLLHVQTGPGVHSTSYKMSTGDFPGGKGSRA